MSAAWLRPPTVRLGPAHAADTIALLLGAVFLWQLFFFAEKAFDPLATTVGLVAIAAPILARSDCDESARSSAVDQRALNVERDTARAYFAQNCIAAGVATAFVRCLHSRDLL